MYLDRVKAYLDGHHLIWLSADLTGAWPISETQVKNKYIAPNFNLFSLQFYLLSRVHHLAFNFNFEGAICSAVNW